jgi:hypothetical protein
VSQSRKRRGMRTQAVIAEDYREWRFPYATDAGAGRPGVDILNADPLATEVKARGTVSLVAQLKKLRADNPGKLPNVTWRHNGQGEASLSDWTVTLFYEDFKALAEAYLNLLEMGEV